MSTVPWTAPSDVTPDMSFEYCQLDADYGLNCKSTNETAWFFNRTSGACETFLFGGCLGNQNRFLLESICHSVCVLRSIGNSRPPASTPRAPTQRTGRPTATAEQVPVRSSPSMPGGSRTSETSSPTQAPTCIENDCAGAGKDCSVSGFLTDAFGCTLCICADPCEVSTVFLGIHVVIRYSSQ